MPKDAITPTAHAIQLYLQSHPNASDSAEGVQRWWLGEEGLLVPYETVVAALNELMMLRLIGQQRLSDGTMLYARAATRSEHPDAERVTGMRNRQP